MWAWRFRAPFYAPFKIDPSRGSKVPVEVLGETFAGVLGCDCFSAYRKHMKCFGIFHRRETTGAARLETALREQSIKIVGAREGAPVTP